MNVKKKNFHHLPSSKLPLMVTVERVDDHHTVIHMVSQKVFLVFILVSRPCQADKCYQMDFVYQMEVRLKGPCHARELDLKYDEHHFLNFEFSV